MTLLDSPISKAHQTRTSQWFEDLRNQICHAFEQLEDALSGPSSDQPAGRFERTAWHRNDRPENGGGVMSVMKGRVFEKVGVNISTVYGEFPEEFAKSIPGAEADPRFWASGISLVAHMHSPLVPAVHMNTRHIITAKDWFGGGGDLNAALPDDRDIADFHGCFQKACDKYDPDYFPKYKKWCDDYFYIKHRNRARGQGGIFYDQLNSGDWEQDFAFTQDVGRAFLEIYPKIVSRHMNEEWTAEQREELLYYRGLYTEFNLIYDRGTTFGLKTGGNVDAILMSLPPQAKWR